MTPLNSFSTNTISCELCSWKRILDPRRPYRGGHTHPNDLYECHGTLIYKEESPLPPEVFLLGAEEEWPFNDRTQEQVDQINVLYELEDNDVTELLDSIG